MSVTAPAVPVRYASGVPVVTDSHGRIELALLDDRGRPFAAIPFDDDAALDLAATLIATVRARALTAPVVTVEPEAVIADAWTDTVHAWLTAHPLS